MFVWRVCEAAIVLVVLVPVSKLLKDKELDLRSDVELSWVSWAQSFLESGAELSSIWTSSLVSNCTDPTENIATLIDQLANDTDILFFSSTTNEQHSGNINQRAFQVYIAINDSPCFRSESIHEHFKLTRASY